MSIIGITAGKWDPVHKMHIQHFQKARALCDKLVCITHPDDVVALARKKEGKVPACWLGLEDRVEVLKAIRWIDEVVVSIDADGGCDETLVQIAIQHPHDKLLFIRGGDRVPSTMPSAEVEVCRELGIEIVYGVGDKGEGSSKVVERVVASLLTD